MAAGGSHAYAGSVKGDRDKLLRDVSRDPARAPVGSASSPVNHSQRIGTIAEVRQRFEREAERQIAQQKRELLCDMLEVIDDLDRAIESARKSRSHADVRAGVELVRESFLSKLAKHGVKPCAAFGLPFDPARHEAITTMPVTAPSSNGTVVEVLRPGYLLGSEVLRPAQVVVGKMG